jgi:hypothetical protein
LKWEGQKSEKSRDVIPPMNNFVFLADEGENVVSPKGNLLCPSKCSVSFEKSLTRGRRPICGKMGPPTTLRTVPHDANLLAQEANPPRASAQEANPAVAA